MGEQSSAKQFLKLWAVITVLMLATITLFIVVVDPYGLYGWVSKAGFNRVKPGLERLQLEIKMAHARQIQPSLVMLGNSRTEIGLDPQAPALQARGIRAYNLAIPGTGLDTTLMQVQQILEFGSPPKQALLGIDFLDFIEFRRVDMRVETSGTKAPPSSRFWKVDALISLVSLEDAVKTVRIQNDPLAQILTADGFNPLQEYTGLAKDEGYFSIFKQKESQYAERFSRATGKLNADDFSQLTAVISRLADAGIEIKLVVYPYHAQILALLDEAGLQPQFEAWKWQVLQIMAKTRVSHPQARLSLTDFSGFANGQCEHIPVKGDHSSITHWYWEGGHFKKSLGDRMLRTLFDEPTSTKTDAFGRVLTPENAGQNSQRMADEEAECRGAYPELFADAKAQFQRAIRRR